MGLAKRIKEVMGDLGPSEFARACGVSPAAVTQWLKADTKALKAEPVAHMEAKFGYRASWIVFGKGPKKIESQPEVPWNLSEDLRKKLVIIQDGELRRVENTLRGSLDMPQHHLAVVAPVKQLSSSAVSASADTRDEEEGIGLPDQMQVPKPIKDVRRTKHRRSAPPKGRRGS
jgi:transcriptional regulator with XRE-family HTH domain